MRTIGAVGIKNLNLPTLLTHPGRKSS
jgi:hypothetical protein